MLKHFDLSTEFNDIHKNYKICYLLANFYKQNYVAFFGD